MNRRVIIKRLVDLNLIEMKATGHWGLTQEGREAVEMMRFATGMYDAERREERHAVADAVADDRPRAARAAARRRGRTKT